LALAYIEPPSPELRRAGASLAPVDIAGMLTTLDAATRDVMFYEGAQFHRQRYEELKAGQQSKWRDLDPVQMRRSGQHEMRNWICLAGAMDGRRPDIITYQETYIFNSSKCVAVFPAP